MSLLDLFRPQWKHSNPDQRLQAVSKLGTENQDLFAQIARNDENTQVRQAAAKRIHQSHILKTFTQDADLEIRQFALSKLQEELLKSVRTHEGALSEEIRQAVQGLRPGSATDDLLRNARSAEVRTLLVQKSGKPGVLVQVALRDADEAVALLALSKIDRESMLQEIASHSRHPVVRTKAQDVLRKRAEKDENLARSRQEEAESALKAKRATVIAHAQRLLDTRDPESNFTEMNQVIAEANQLGMGSMQADFDAVCNVFEDRLKEQRDAIASAEAAKQAAILRKQKIQELLDECESLVNEGQNADARLQTCKSQWLEISADASPEQEKRFRNALQRAERRQQMAQQAEMIQLDEAKSAELRSSLLEQLTRLIELEDMESVERQLRGLVREWDSLNRLDESDSSQQSFVALRDRIAGKLDQVASQKEQAHQQVLLQLRGLIERVQQLDENQDFKEISRILRQTYLEWKDLVGEEKFRFHDIWKEYRAATARFEEMKEWESWRNDQEREHIIKEIESLLQVSDPAEAMGKLRHQQQLWKDAGFVPQPRLQELWDRYKAVVEQVMAHFHDYVEEQNAQKQRNLEAKIALCAELEQLALDPSDNWKEKSKRVQQMQEDWKAAGPVPRDQNQPIWERFRAGCDAFYKQHKVYLSKEDDNRQDNLGRKIALCEQAEALKESDDWNGTTLKLRKLQDEWKATGPVPKSQSEEIWARFRDAADAFFQRKRAHFEDMDREKVENLAKKEALCAKLETLDLTKPSAEADEQIAAAESEWRSIGMVPKDSVEALWSRWCNITDRYTELKAQSSAELREELLKRKEAKQSMIERVRELCEEAGSNQASDMVRDMQDDWKQMGRCGESEQDLYRQFRDVCDDFFEARRDQLDIQEQARRNNLQRKLQLVDVAEKLLQSGDLGEQSIEEVKHLRRQWKEVGAVPREHSDRIWKRFNGACDSVFVAVRGERPQQADSGTNERPNRGGKPMVRG